MANTISMPEGQKHLVESISMSNGLTAVFIELLVISGSIVTQTNRERELIIWLAQHDQSIVGIGTIGFDIDEMPWTLDYFDQEKDFLIRTITSAINGLGWSRLGYEPRKDWIIEQLEHFQLMISTFDKQFVNETQYREWSEIEENDDNPTIPLCNNGI
ncbi:hypothetical protein [Paenibacillus alkalitolerans]|uniref:hypothetical protein n=1 Tax=Paenibacillus alkalitolerans TaxID=2799335 RepID=UPI0018F68C2B|nr:hypothetical protein [Paenibacillus alkalitolerans]